MIIGDYVILNYNNAYCRGIIISEPDNINNFIVHIISFYNEPENTLSVPKKNLSPFRDIDYIFLATLKNDKQLFNKHIKKISSESFTENNNWHKILFQTLNSEYLYYFRTIIEHENFTLPRNDPFFTNLFLESVKNNYTETTKYLLKNVYVDIETLDFLVINFLLKDKEYAIIQEIFYLYKKNINQLKNEKLELYNRAYQAIVSLKIKNFK
jgi:hypothetical protein